MRGAKSAKWVAGAVVVALAATACGGGSDDGGSDSDKGAVDPNGMFSDRGRRAAEPAAARPTPMESNG